MNSHVNAWTSAFTSLGYVPQSGAARLPGLPPWLSHKQSTCRAEAAGGVGLVPGLGWCPGVRNGTPLQNSCLKNPMDSGAWWVTAHEVAKSQTRLKWLSAHAPLHTWEPLSTQDSAEGLSDFSENTQLTRQSHENATYRSVFSRETK